MASISKKVVAVGDAGCGKRSLLTVFSTDKFPDEESPRIYQREVEHVVDGKKVVLSLYSTAGEKFLRVVRFHDGHV